MKFLLGKLWKPLFRAIDLKGTLVKIRDGAGTPAILTAKIGDGTLSFTEKRNLDYVLDLGILDDVTEGDDIPMDVNFDFTWEYLKAITGTPTVEDALKQRGQASAWVSTDSDACRPYSVDVLVVHAPVCQTTDAEDIILPDFRYDQIDHRLKDKAITATGRCNATDAIVSRFAQST